MRRLFGSETLAVDHFENGGDATVVSFSLFRPSGGGSTEGLGYGGKFLLDHGFDVVAFKTTRNVWFQDVPRAALEAVDAAVATPRIGYGSSMGAYAALLFAAPLRLQRVLAISPQHDPRDDGRWKRHVKDEAFLHELRAAPGCEYFLVYDSVHPDARHVERIAEICPCTRVPLPHSGHGSLEFLEELGLVKPFVLSILREGAVPDLSEIERRQEESAIFRAHRQRYGPAARGTS